MNNIQKDLRLLPTYFKKIAFSLIGVSILFLVLSITKLLPLEKELVKLITKNTLLISLLLLAITSNKVEDELTHKNRLKAFAGAFIFGVVFTIVSSISNYLFPDFSNSSNTSTTYILIQMFFIYFISLYTMKKKES